MKTDIIIVDNFYSDPLQVREYAIRELQRNRYLPYGANDWHATKFKDWFDCPFKSCMQLVSALSTLTSEEVDLDFWKLSYPEHGSEADRIRENKSCKWNCTFHFKPITGQKMGQGVHNHVTDVWNCVGNDGWVGLIYLNPTAPMGSGLCVWENHQPQRNFDWMTPEENWKLIDSYGAVFNRLILTRGERPHSGADGFSDDLHRGRLYQTFFFKSTNKKSCSPVSVSLSSTDRESS